MRGEEGMEMASRDSYRSEQKKNCDNGVYDFKQQCTEWQLINKPSEPQVAISVTVISNESY